METAEVHVAAAHHVESARLKDQAIEDADVVDLAVGDAHKRGNVAAQVEEGMEFDGALRLGVTRAIDVIPNLVDANRCDPDFAAAHRRRLSPDSAPLLVHDSNFRPVKRIMDVLEVFRRVHAEVPSHLALVGDGPERSDAEKFVRDAGIAHRVEFLGNVTPVEGV